MYAHRRLPIKKTELKNKYYILGLQYLNLIFVLLAICAFSENGAPDYWKWFAIVVLATLFNFLIFSFIKLITVKCWVMEDKLKKCRRDLLIGYALMTSCGIVQQVVVLGVGWNSELRDKIIGSTYLVCSFTAPLSIALFILPYLHRDTYQVKKRRNSLNLCLLIVSSHLLISLFAGVLTFDKRSEFMFLVFIMTSWIYAPCSAEFMVILKNGVWLKKRAVGVQTSASKPTTSAATITVVSYDSNSSESSIDIDDRPSASECNICLIGYSNQVIPRIMVGCGHTVCQACIEKLPRQEGQVQCPFCRKPTRLPDDQPCQLPKNYAILDIIQEMRQ